MGDGADGACNWKVSLMICRSSLYDNRYYSICYFLFGSSSLRSCAEWFVTYFGILLNFLRGCFWHRWQFGYNLWWELFLMEFYWSVARVVHLCHYRILENACSFWLIGSDNQPFIAAKLCACLLGRVWRIAIELYERQTSKKLFIYSVCDYYQIYFYKYKSSIILTPIMDQSFTLASFEVGQTEEEFWFSSWVRSCLLRDMWYSKDYFSMAIYWSRRSYSVLTAASIIYAFVYCWSLFKDFSCYSSFLSLTIYCWAKPYICTILSFKEVNSSE